MNRRDGRFRNPWPIPSSNRTGGFLRWVLYERLTKELPADPDPSVFKLAEPAFRSPRAAVDELTVTWVGHSTVLLQLGELNVLTDPHWSKRASPVQLAGPARWVRPGVRFEALPPIDLVLISHNHYDHLDGGTVRKLAATFPDAAWCVPLGLASFVRARGACDVEEMDWWDETLVGGARVTCTPAQHFSARTALDRNKTLWCGWALASGERRVFFAGDTGYHPKFGEIGERLGPFDVALLPVGAYEPRWFMQPVHMNPEEAVQAYRDVTGQAGGSAEARCAMVPIHWGTFKLTDEAMDEPPRRTMAAWAETALPHDDLWLLAHGESRTTRPRDGRPTPIW
ncbi:MAG TPA: MBL fold metallo-hydrolase [Gemmatimonadota bacterium]|nr:MBL fold metallo-hydrolase [Gemmatimonadota bacterium]